MNLSNNTKSVSVSILLPLFIIFYFNSCMSGFIKETPYLNIIVVIAWIVSFISTTDFYAQKKFISLIKPLLFCLAWLAFLLLIGKDKVVGGHLNSSLFNCIYLAMIVLIYAKYSQPEKEAERKFIFNFWLIDTVLSCIYTIYRLEEKPELSRYLATASQTREKLLTNVDTRGIVSYGAVYGLLFILPFLIQRFTNNNNNYNGKLLAAILSLIFFATIIEAQFAIAIIIAFGLFFSSVVLKNSRNSLNVIVFILLSILLLFFVPYILEFILSTDILKDTSAVRMREILALLNNESIAGTDLNTRLNVYANSIKVILESVFLGRVIIKTPTVTGGHSELLDSIANYGLIYGVMLISFFVRIYKDVREKTYDDCKTTYFIVQLAMLFLSLVNTSMWMPLPMILTLIVPFYIIDYGKSNGEKIFTEIKYANSRN